MLAALTLLALLAAWQSTSWSQDVYSQGAPLDPPGQVARLNLAQGPVSFAPADAAGEDAWTPAVLNRPLTRGDRLWTGPRARAELHAGSTAVRMSEETSLELSALDESVTQLRLAQGTIQLRVRTLFEGQRLEVDTPNLAFVISQPGDYRLDVDPASGTTRVVAQSGGGTLYGDGVSLALGSPQQGSFSGARLTPAAAGAALQDGFDAWAADRDRREDQSISARYIPRETIGYQQLDSYGDWQQDPAYGAVWLPRAVPLDWAPYRAGHWSWISPWGWTWVDDAPWGFAPFHYGRWTQIGPRWAWVPGRLPQRPVYAPALVAFVGGGNWRGAAGQSGVARPALGWFPLAPGEAFRPAYRTSPSYVSRVNNNIAVNNTVNTVNTVNLYRYQHQPAAVTALSRDDFARGRPVQGRLQAPGVADLSGAQVLIDHSALPQRPERSDLRERPRPEPAAMPPAAPAAQAAMRSQTEHAGRVQANPPVPPLAPVPLAAPAAAAAVNVVPPAARIAPALTPDRHALEAEQRARREQERQHQQLQREQQRQQLQQSDLARQQEVQRRQGEAALLQQRALQEQAHRQQEMLRQQAHEQQRRQGEEALGRQRALQEQARQQAQQQRAIAQHQPVPQVQDRQQARPPEVVHRRAPSPEGGSQRHREP